MAPAHARSYKKKRSWSGRNSREGPSWLTGRIEMTIIPILESVIER